MLALLFTALVSVDVCQAIWRLQPALALVVDDLGYREDYDQRAVSLQGVKNLAILPFTPGGRSLAESGHRLGKEILLHLPMQAEKHNQSLGPGALSEELDHAAFGAAFRAAAANIPHVRGVNNHMGSRLTTDPLRMAWLMALLKEQDLYFLDSRTTAASVAAEQAEQAHLPFLVRDFFLDHVRTHEHILEQWEQSLELARSRGFALALAHPHPETLAVLTSELPLLEDISLVKVSELLLARECEASFGRGTDSSQAVAQ